jgi:hypothetical protein
LNDQECIKSNTQYEKGVTETIPATPSRTGKIPANQRQNPNFA